MKINIENFLKLTGLVIGFTLGVLLRFALLSFNVWAALYFLNHFGFLGFLEG